MIEGYASRWSAAPGESVGLFLSGPSGRASLTVQRYAGPESARVAARVGTQLVPRNAWTGYGWTQTVAFTVPQAWPSAYYRVLNGGAVVTGFVVRAAKPGATSKILLSVDMITNQAYNGAGGASLYDPNRAETVSFDRPAAPPVWPLPDTRELPLHDWLAAEGIAVECCASPDLGLPGLLDPYECLVIAGHAEYWTRAMYEQVAAFVARGGNVVCLSGNTCYRQVRIEGRALVFHKYAGHDLTPFDPDVTVAFAEPPVNRSQAALLGVSFTHAAWGAPAGSPAPYELRFPGHWAMAGVAAARTQPFLGYETDAAAYVEEPEGYPRVTGEEGTPVTFVPLGTADLRDGGWAKPGFATMGVYRRNGTVFAAGTTDWVDALTGQPGFPLDPSVGTITRNVLARLRSRVPADWEDVGPAPAARALTAAGPRLFLASTANRLLRRHPVAAEVPWRDVGHAIDVTAMASDGDALFCVTADDRLWWRPSVELEVDWTAIGPAMGGSALAYAGGMLYTTDAAGAMYRRPARRTAGAAWVPVNLPGQPFTALASFADILFGSTTGNRLLRTNKDFIAESDGWKDIHRCDLSVGLAAVGGSLFVATSNDRLWWLDLHGLRQP